MIYRGRQLFDLKVGLVLAGGGAKGAYQAGVLNALWDLDLVDNVEVVSGVSIGTLNAICFSMKNRRLIDQSWQALSYSKIVSKNDGMTMSNLTEWVKKFATHKGDQPFEALDIASLGLISQKGIRDYIKEYVDVSVINQTDMSIYGCAYNVTDGHPDYFRLNDYSEEEIIDITLGSCAVPYIFPPVMFHKKQYADGGINNPLYPQANADNVPIYPLKNHELDLIIVVHLNYTDKIDRTKYRHPHLMEIYPSSPLEVINGVGTLNFNQASIAEKIQLGYQDALMALTPMLIAYLKGKNMTPYIRRHARYNEQFLKKYVKESKPSPKQ